jgi:hypothetical protein
MGWLSGVLQKIPIKCARVGRKNKDGTVGEPWKEIYFFLVLCIHTWHRYMWGGSKRTASAIKTSTIIDVYTNVE